MRGNKEHVLLEVRVMASSLGIKCNKTQIKNEMREEESKSRENSSIITQCIKEKMYSNNFAYLEI